MQGQLGLGEAKFSVDIPTEIEELADKNVTKVVAYGDVSAALTEDGEIYVWGKVIGGALGAQFTNSLLLPKLLELGEAKFTNLSIGHSQLAAVTSDGRLVTWKVPEEQNIKNKRQARSAQLELSYVEGLDGLKFTEVTCGKHHSAALTDDGKVYTWGAGKEGALGHGDFEAQTSPKEVEGLSGVKSISNGGDFTVALTTKGELYAFGRNSYGQIGKERDSVLRANTPVKISMSRLFTPDSVDCGEEHCALVTESNQVFTWGYGNDGQLAHGNKNSLAAPKHVKVDGEWTTVACGGGHTGFISKTGELYMVGRGRDGQLGRGDQVESIAAYRADPVKCEALKEFNVKDLALGANHSIALVSQKK